MKSHKQKMTAPIVVCIIMVLYYCLYFGVLISAVDGLLKYVLGIAPIAFSALTVKVCAERINEIKKGEEDDLSQY